MKNIPNLITAGRIVVSICLLFIKPLSVLFFFLYFAAGISDVLDGVIARKINYTSQKGAVLDSVADFVLIWVLLFKFIPILTLSFWMLCWIGIIIFLRFISLGIGFIKYHTIAFLHTYSNKITGLALFFFPVFFSVWGLTVTIILLCSLASLSAMEELAINIISKKLNRNCKSIWVRD